MATATALRNGVTRLSLAASDDLGVLWRSVDTPELAREALRDVLPSLIDAYGSASATLAADWYDELRHRREVRGNFRANPVEIGTPGTAGAAELAGWGVGPLFGATPDWAAAQVLVAGGLQRRIANASRLTVMDSAIKDPRARGWAREGDGDTCEFCSMLIGRGAVYSEASADFESHDHCGCAAVPAF